MQHPSLRPRNSANAHPRPLVRFNDVVDLTTGEAVLAVAETNRSFEDGTGFGPAARLFAEDPQPHLWFADLLEDIAAAALLLERRERPLIAAAPPAALSAATFSEACDTAMARTKLCPQEIAIEAADAALASGRVDPCVWIAALRKRGFRVAIDARRTWSTALARVSWLMVDSIRVDARTVWSDGALQDYCGAASEAGVSIIADRPKWREADALASLGIRYGCRPAADS